MSRRNPSDERRTDPDPYPASSRLSRWSGIRHRRIRLVLYVLIAAIFFLALLPSAIGFGLTTWLRAQGVSSASVGDIDFNPVAGRLVIRDLRTDEGGATLAYIDRLAVQFDWFPLWRKRAFVSRVDIRGAHLTVEHRAADDWRIGGIPLTPRTPLSQTDTGNPSVAWGFGVGQMQISDSDIYYIGAAGVHDLHIDAASLSQVKTWKPQGSTRVTLRGALDGAGLRLKAHGRPLAVPMEAEGQLRFDAFDLNGDLGRVVTNSQAVAKVGVRHVSGRLSIDSELRVSWRPAGHWHVTQRGTVTVAGLMLSGVLGQLDQQQLTWLGTVDADGSWPRRVRDTVRINADGRLDARRTRWRSANGHWRGEQSDMQWRGHLSLGAGEAPRIEGAVQAKGLNVAATVAQDEVLHVDRATVDGISVRDIDNWRIARLSAHDVRVLGEPKAALLQAGNVDGEQLTFSDRRLAVKAVLLKAVQFELSRRADGRWAYLQRLDALRGEVPVPAASRSKVGRVRVTIGSVRLLGGSRLTFEDRSVTPAYRQTLHFEQAQLADLDSAASAHKSAFSLSARVNRYGHLDASGTVAIFASPVALQVEAQLRALDLPPLSGYTTRQLGYEIRSGHLDAKAKLGVAAGRLDGTMQLVFNNLDVASRDTAQVERLNTQLGMSLEAALAVLRDADNDVHLSVPISGNIADPTFGFGDAFNQALGKAMRLAAVGYLKNYLQPFGSLITIVQLAGGVNLLRLDPVFFTPGRIDLTPDARVYLERVAKLLKEKPSLRLRLRPIAVVADRTGASGTSETGILELATHRAEVLKAALVTRGGIASGRLFVCGPVLDSEPAARPRVDLGL